MNGPLRVILNDRPLRQTLTGVGHYIAQLLLHLPEVTHDVHLDPFVFTHLSRGDWRQRLAETPSAVPAQSASASGAPDSQQRDVGGSRKPWWLRRFVQGAYGVLFRRAARRYQLYHEPNHIPIRCDLPTVTTVHDLSVVVHPEWHPRDRVQWYENEFDAGVRQTSRFIAVSEFTKREMVARLGLAPDTIDVTYQAPRPAFGAQPPAVVDRVRRALDLPRRFFLYVGTLEPRKNVAGLLDAFAALPGELRREHPLIIVGAWGWKHEALREKLAARALASDVRLLGYMNDTYLACLYSLCTALVWPTLYEGFGMPPLETMACGGPVIVSDVASLPEVVGEAGVLLDPRDTAAWTAAMQRLAEDEGWHGRCAAAGLRQAATFTWEQCVRKTLACFRTALAES
ncbi:MAG: glycosyltransferase family 4 protein [Planctomycetes bacterium]|nr:glycosyltransferase family 4 protein [Planctomycetota bacterium]